MTYLPLLLQLMLYSVDTNVKEVVINSFNRSATAFLSALSTVVCLICFNRDVCKFNKLNREGRERAETTTEIRRC